MMINALDVPLTFEEKPAENQLRMIEQKAADFFGGPRVCYAELDAAEKQQNNLPSANYVLRIRRV